MTERKHLIFDADDTLWENNVVFEQVIADFLDWLEHPTLGRDELRRLLDDVERANVVAHGYGTRVFTRSLHDTVERVRDQGLSDSDRDEIARLVKRLEWEELELLPNVAETLEQLSRRHDLLLLTKGDEQEQALKLHVSGLKPLFREAFIVPEKHAPAYVQVVVDAELDRSRAWMIGNSPRSDVLPALAAGLQTVLIPHPHTWRLEQVDLPDDAPVLRLERFAELLDHF
jgi:putative hydrolase of the HAD superfamily